MWCECGLGVLLLTPVSGLGGRDQPRCWVVMFRFLFRTAREVVSFAIGLLRGWARIGASKRTGCDCQQLKKCDSVSLCGGGRSWLAGLWHHRAVSAMLGW